MTTDSVSGEPRPEPDMAGRYRLAQARKMIRLGLVTIDANGDIVPTAALDHEMNAGPIRPDPCDFD